MAAAVQKRLDSSFELMQTVPALFNVKPDATRAEFSRFVKLAGSSYAAIQWAPRVTEATRAEFEQAAQAGVAKNFEIREAKGESMLVRAQVRAVYVPLLYIEPPNPGVLGFDLWSEATRRSYVERCRDSGRAVISERFELIEEELPTPALAAYLPVYAPGQPISTQQQRRAAFAGVAVGVLALRDLVPSALAGFDTSKLDIALVDSDAKTEEDALLFESSLGAKVGVEASPMAAAFPLALGDRRSPADMLLPQLVHDPASPLPHAAEPFSPPLASSSPSAPSAPSSPLPFLPPLPPLPPPSPPPPATKAPGFIPGGAGILGTGAVRATPGRHHAPDRCTVGSTKSRHPSAARPARAFSDSRFRRWPRLSFCVGL